MANADDEGVESGPPSAPDRHPNGADVGGAGGDAPGGPSGSAAPCGPVFVSHSSRDAAIAVQFVNALEATGVPCWVAPRDIPPGSDYNGAIMSGLTAARALLLVFSRHSAESEPVAREVERALNHKVPVIPVRLDHARPSGALEYMISSAQWVDALPPPAERHVSTVADAVGRALRPPRPAQRDARRDPNADPQYLGHYRLLEPVDTGGMGTVYKAEQRHPVRRIVAVKRIKAGFDSAEVIARFESERQALARMDHPNVATVLDAGADEFGRPYFVMEYIPGSPITDFADDQKLTVRERLILFTQACDAIAHAHTKALIHRDVKPSNVLAYVADERPTVKVIDFGIAKALTGDRLTDRTLHTAHGQAVGTFESMSPEQADGRSDVDTRTDVYSLGVLLYELLAGAKPFDGPTLARAGDTEARRVIREVDPPRPSTRLSAMPDDAAARVAANRQSYLAGLSRALRKELEWIPLKAMRKERDRRYASPLQLAEDCRRYLAGKPLIAGPEGQWYRARKFAVRNRVVLTATAAAVVAAVVPAAVEYNDAKASRAAAARSAEVARRQQALTLATLRQLIDEVERKLSQTENKSLRLQFLQMALDGLSRLDRNPDVATQADLGTVAVHVQLADVQTQFGDPEKARKAYGDATAVLEQLARDNSADARARLELAASCLTVVKAARDHKCVPEAARAHKTGLAVLRSVANDGPAEDRAAVPGLIANLEAEAASAPRGP